MAQGEWSLAKEEDISAHIAACHALVLSGASREEILFALSQARGKNTGDPPSVLGVARIIKEVYGLSLRDALTIVQEDPTWRDEASHP